MADERKLPESVETAAQMMYRSGGLGVWGAVLRFGGMPLEKIALLCVAVLRPPPLASRFDLKASASVRVCVGGCVLAARTPRRCRARVSCSRPSS